MWAKLLHLLEALSVCDMGRQLAGGRHSSCVKIFSLFIFLCFLSWQQTNKQTNKKEREKTRQRKQNVTYIEVNLQSVIYVVQNYIVILLFVADKPAEAWTVPERSADSGLQSRSARPCWWLCCKVWLCVSFMYFTACLILRELHLCCMYITEVMFCCKMCICVCRLVLL